MFEPVFEPAVLFSDEDPGRFSNKNSVKMGFVNRRMSCTCVCTHIHIWDMSSCFTHVGFMWNQQHAGYHAWRWLHPLIDSILSSTPSSHRLLPLIDSFLSSTPSSHRLRPLADSILSLTPSSHQLLPLSSQKGETETSLLLFCDSHRSLIFFLSCSTISISITSGHWKAPLCEERTMRREGTDSQQKKWEKSSEPFWIYFSRRRTYINLLLLHCQTWCGANRERKEEKGQSRMVSSRPWGGERLPGCIKESVISDRRQLFGKGKRKWEKSYD